MFMIQASAPKVLISSDLVELEDGALSAAIGEVFACRTENLIMFWQGVPTSLNYKYVLARSIYRVLDMLEALLNANGGRHEINWIDEDFRADWHLEWDECNLSIHAEWQVVADNVLETLQGIEEPLQVGISEFLAEWKRPLTIVQSALASSGCSRKQVPDLVRFQEILAKLPNEGYLYPLSEE